LGRGAPRDEKLSEETRRRVRELNIELGYPTVSANRSYRGGFDTEGRGTPNGDGKDAAMRADAKRSIGRSIVELDGSGGASSSQTTEEQLGRYAGERRMKVMLARNGTLKGPLRAQTEAKLSEAYQNECTFVVGDMPGVDTPFISFLDERQATYTVYYGGRDCRIRTDFQRMRFA
jgi:hypothetical protein